MRADIRGFIFDLDGTLVDSLADIGQAMNRALAGQGYPMHALAAYRGFVGEGVAELARRALPAALLAGDPVELAARHAALVAAYQRDYAEHMLDDTRPYPGVAALVATLVAAGHRLAVLSNKPDAPTRHIATALFPAGSFVATVGQREGVPKKPDPTAARALLAALDLPASAVAFVGDTAVDMLTARAAGLYAVGVTWGFRPGELVAAGADLVVSEAAELVPPR
jgi:phosphoglycolate phosphatase